PRTKTGRPRTASTSCGEHGWAMPTGRWWCRQPTTRRRATSPRERLFKDGVVAASYDFGLVKLSGAWRRFKFADSRQTNMLLAAIVPVGAGQVKVSYQRANLDGTVGTADVSDNDGSQLGLGYVHNLSKRTALYATYSRISNSGVATFVVPGGNSGMTA